MKRLIKWTSPQLNLIFIVQPFIWIEYYKHLSNLIYDYFPRRHFPNFYLKLSIFESSKEL